MKLTPNKPDREYLSAAVRGCARVKLALRAIVRCAAGSLDPITSVGRCVFMRSTHSADRVLGRILNDLLPQLVASVSPALCGPTLL